MRFEGILPAAVTPLDDEGRFLAPAFEKLLERLYGAGVHGVYVCGQTGEGLTLPLDERRTVAEVAVRNSPPGKQVIVHVGAHRTEDAIALARHASRAGAHAVSSLPPSGAYNFEEVKRYYAAVAGASEVPFLVYFFPEVNPNLRTLDQILELCALPNVAGLKFTDFNFFHLDLIKRRGHTLFNGRDEALASGLLSGADGGIGTFYNLAPELFLEIYAAARAGDWDGAMRAQRKVNDLIAFVLRFPMLAAVKQMLSWSGIPCGRPAPPRAALTAEETARLAVEVRQAGYTAFTAPS